MGGRATIFFLIKKLAVGVFLNSVHYRI